MTLTQPMTRRWTREEYYRMAEAGLFKGQRVEPVDGEVIEMPPPRDEHAHTVRLVDYALRNAFGDGFVISIQMPLNLGEHSQPEPDVAVIRGSVRSVKRHPTTAVLVVEVADATLEYDRSVKAGLYAAAGIREYWIINLVERKLEMLRRPRRKAGTRFAAEYQQEASLSTVEQVSPRAAAKVKLRVRDLLP